MATPIPPTPPGTPAQVAQQQQVQEVQRAQAAQVDELRALAMTMQKPELSFEPCTYRKGIVLSVSTGPPSTISINISGDVSTTIAGVRHLDEYAPVVGQTCLLLKQGSDLLAVGHIASDAPATPWITATLNSGWTHDANSNGDLMYRRVLDHGVWKMQWKGSVNRTSGDVIVSGLPLEYRPANRTSLIMTRSASGGSNVVKVDFATNGDVEVYGMDVAPNLSLNVLSIGTQNSLYTAHSHGGSTGTTSSHNHSISNTDHRHGVPGHDHSVSASVSVDAPPWITFQGAEYFLD